MYITKEKYFHTELKCPEHPNSQEDVYCIRMGYSPEVEIVICAECAKTLARTVELMSQTEIDSIVAH